MEAEGEGLMYENMELWFMERPGPWPPLRWGRDLDPVEWKVRFTDGPQRQLELFRDGVKVGWTMTVVASAPPAPSPPRVVTVKLPGEARGTLYEVISEAEDGTLDLRRLELPWREWSSSDGGQRQTSWDEGACRFWSGSYVTDGSGRIGTVISSEERATRVLWPEGEESAATALLMPVTIWRRGS